MCRGKGHWDTAQTEHSSAREDMCTTGQPDSAAARGAGPARPAGVSKVCQGVSTAQAVLPECDQRGRSEGNQIRSSLRARVCACVCADSCYLRPCGMLHIPGRWASCPVKTERESVLAKTTQRTREQALGSGLSHPHSLSVAPCLFPLKHFRCSQQLLLDLGPRSNLRQPHPLPSAGVGPASPHPHTPTAPRAPVGVGSANANSFKCQLEQHEARKANRGQK